MSLVFIPGVSNTAVRVDWAGSSIISILEKKSQQKARKTCVYCDVPWSVFTSGRWNRLRCNNSKLARFYGRHAFEICSSVDSLDKSRVSKGFEALMVCNVMSWTHCGEDEKYSKEYISEVEQSFYTLSAIPVILGSKRDWTKGWAWWSSKARHYGHVPVRAFNLNN